MPTTNNEILSDKSPTGDLCLFVTIPNNQEWLWMFAKAVAQPSLRRWWYNDDSGEADIMRDAWDSRVYQPLVETILTGECCVAIADCIENNVTTQTAIGIAIENNSELAITINNIMQNIGTIDPDKIDPDIALIPTRFPQSERDNNVHIPPPSCDKDTLWAGIRETVTRLDDGARQFLEQAVAQADKAERAANIISAIPIVGDLTAALITTFSELAPDLLNLFNAYSSQQNIDDTACALFEIVCQDCRYPTYQEYWDHFSNLGISGLSDIGSLTFTAITDLLFGTQNLAALVAYHTIISYQLYVLYLGSKFTSYRGTKWLNIWADIGEDNPNNGWELLCDGCEDIPQSWCRTIDFLTTNGGYVDTTNTANVSIWESGIGWHGSAGSDADQTIISYDFGQSINMNTVTVDFRRDAVQDVIQLRCNAPSYPQWDGGAASPIITPDSVVNLSGNLYRATFTVNDAITNWIVYIDRSGTTSVPLFWVENIVMNGDGGNIPVGDVC